MENEEIKRIIIDETNQDSVEIRELAKGNLAYSVKIHFDADNKIEDIVGKINKVKDAIEKDVLKRGGI